MSNASVQDDEKLLLESDYTTKIDGLIEQLSNLKEFIGYNLSEKISVVDNKNKLRAIGFRHCIEQVRHWTRSSR